LGQTVECRLPTMEKANEIEGQICPLKVVLPFHQTRSAHWFMNGQGMTCLNLLSEQSTYVRKDGASAKVNSLIIKHLTTVRGYSSTPQTYLSTLI
jgi:hypothetical protein